MLPLPHPGSSSGPHGLLNLPTWHGPLAGGTWGCDASSCLSVGWQISFPCPAPGPFLGANNPTSVSNVQNCAGNEDIVTLRGEADQVPLALVLEAPNQEKLSGNVGLGILEPREAVEEKLPSGECACVRGDLSHLGDPGVPSCAKDRASFPPRAEAWDQKYQVVANERY